MPSTGPAGHDWDASSYDRLPLPHEGWGAALLGRLPLSGDEHVLEAGCGTGRDTALLLERLPRGHVTAVDASVAMLRRLRERLEDGTDRLTVLHADLSHRLTLTRPVDAVFSVATLHWIADRETVFQNFATVMRPGAQLAFECGGLGNIQAVLAAVHRATGDDSADIGWHFAGATETRRLLARSGFVDVHARLREEPVRLASAKLLREYLTTVILGRHVGRLAPEDRPGFVEAVAAEMSDPVVDYVRLEVTARRR